VADEIFARTSKNRYLFLGQKFGLKICHKKVCLAKKRLNLLYFEKLEDEKGTFKVSGG